jgi:hypothetical protein
MHPSRLPVVPPAVDVREHASTILAELGGGAGSESGVNHPDGDGRQGLLVGPKHELVIEKKLQEG